MSEKEESLSTPIRGTTLLHLALSNVFPEWSSNRIARWLGINPRTLQRMLNGESTRNSEIPEGLLGKISSTGQRVQTFELGRQLDDIIESAREYEIDDEVIGAWLASRYKRLLKRDID